MKEIINKIQKIKTWIDKNQGLSDFQKSNNKYMDFAVEIGNHIRYLMFISAGLIPEGKTGYNKQDAVIVGLFVRLCKLYDTLCLHVAENHGEIVQIFVRLIFETSIKIEYLIKNDKNPVENFIFTSYKATKEQYEDLLEKEKSRGLIEIEKRILLKIKGQLEEDEIDVTKLLKNKDWKLDAKTFKDILRELNFESAYSYIFGSGSSYVHGDWKDLRANHLRCKNGIYSPELKYDRVDPRYICPMSVVCLDTLVKLLVWNKSDPDKFIISIAKKLEELVRKFDADHEKVLQDAYNK